MVIVPEATHSMRPAEPLVQLQLAEFVRLRERMQALNLSNVVTDRRNAKLFAMNLCDTSREIVFRLHRITRRQLSQLIAEFHEAATIIEDWPLGELAEADRMAVLNYAKHIHERAETLRKHLIPPA